jgi:2-polyprenyl-3-methyl-5-hydroxy-6-metoxy-1,4-benzoquinol methylase
MTRTTAATPDIPTMARRRQNGDTPYDGAPGAGSTQAPAHRKHTEIQMPPSARFWDRIAQRYARRPVSDEAAYQKKLAVTREYFRPEMEVLEFGCGTGSTALAHAPYVKHVRAFDLSTGMIEIARQKAETAGIGNVTFEVSSVEELAVADASLDAVLGLSVLHLLDDKSSAIAKAYRMLKPGGVYITSTPCLADSLKYVVLLALIGLPGRLLGLLPRVAVFSSETLVKALTDAGFQIDYQWQPASDKPAFIVARKP